MAKKTQYYSCKKLINIPANYYIAFGERANGKSYTFKEYVFERFRDYGEEFIYLRRYADDVKVGLTDRWLSDPPVEKIFPDKNIAYNRSGNIMLAHVDDDGKETNPVRCGYVRSLATAQRYSSGAYPKVTTIIFEEFIALDGYYLPNEVATLQHLVSTVARRRDIKVILIGNSISRLCPYFSDFGLTNILKQEQGTIDVYEIKNDDGNITTVACEYCANTAGRSSMFFGASSKMTNTGKWNVRDFPRLPKPRDTWELVYTAVLTFEKNRFLIEWLINNLGEMCAYVSPKTTPVKPNTRQIVNTNTVDVLTTRGFIPLSESESKLFNMLIQGRIFYSDNLTGTEFNEVFKRMRNNPLVDKTL